MHMYEIYSNKRSTTKLPYINNSEEKINVGWIYLTISSVHMYVIECCIKGMKYQIWK